MKYVIRVHVVNYTDDSHLATAKNDLSAFCRIFRIPQPKLSGLPGGDCLNIDPNSMTERKSFYCLQALIALSLNPHFVCGMREVEDDYFSVS
jgi:hypothetical protein